MAHRFDHGHIKSQDPRKLAQWWADMFGAKLLPEHGSGEVLFCPIEIDGFKINISSPSAAEAAKMDEGIVTGNFGLEHLGLVTDDLDADLARLREQGLHIFEERESPTMRMAFVETPENVRLEIIQHLT
jgi:catechol 2,3-dioxygenase-like lactoylglutathione lyase family enzyme